MQIDFVQFQLRGDDRGALVVLEDQKEVPFPIRRVYYVFGTKKDIRRGFHAHKALHQLAIVVKGSCRFHLADGTDTAEVLLDDPAKGLLLPPMLWHEMYDFSEDCVLMVLADAHYDESDYIRDHNNFLKLTVK